MNYDLRNGDCIDIMRTLPDNSVDSIVTDPPYELGFMGKSWDSTGIAYSVKMWDEVLRVLKPGGHLLAFSGSRTYHRMVVAIEDAGFEIRDQIMWVYGSGFPKSLDVSKAIDKQARVEREVVSSFQRSGRSGGILGKESEITRNITAPATDKAIQWQGWGTALKPAHEPIVVARKPLAEKTVAANVLAYGTGALNIDRSRVTTDDNLGREVYQTQSWKNTSTAGVGSVNDDWKMGRWPANVIHDGSDEVVELFPNTNGRVGNTQYGSGTNTIYGTFSTESNPNGSNGVSDSGSAARFFYCAKASKRDRNEGLDGFEVRGKVFNGQSSTPAGNADGSVEDKFSTSPSANFHPTVKPTELMRYLVRLVTPPNGTVLDPFMGSGSTGKAAMLEGFNFIGCELDLDYIAIAKARIKYALTQRTEQLF